MAAGQGKSRGPQDAAVVSGSEQYRGSLRAAMALKKTISSG